MKNFLISLLFIAATITASAADNVISFTSSDGTELSGTLSVPDNCEGCPLVILVGEEGYDQDNTLNLPLEGLGSCFFNSSLQGEVKPFKQIADYLSSRGMYVFRYEQRATSGLSGEDTNLSYAAVQADLRAAISAAVSESGVESSNVHILSHNTGFDLATSMLDEFEIHSLTALSPQAARVDSVMASRVEKYYELCLGQKTIGAFIGKEMRTKADSIYKGTLTSGSITPYEGLPFYGQYPTFWKGKMEVSASKIEAVNEWDGEMLIVYGSSDQFINTQSVMQLASRLTLGDDLTVESVQGLNNILTISPSTNIDPATMDAVANFILGPTSVERISKDLIADYQDHIEYKGQGLINIRMYDINGRLLSESSESIIEKPENSGFYILLITTDKGQESYKFVR